MRLIDADALKREWKLGDVCEKCQQDARRCEYRYDYTLMDICEMLDDAPTVGGGGWISVQDRLPEIGKLALVYGSSGAMTVARHVAGNEWVVSGIFSRVTHWMPLPEAPKEDDSHEML